MREIKFRAWDKDRGKMCHFGLFDLDGHYSYVDYYRIPDECPVMQYTGLKDKNGKEIYEGDIVEFGEVGDRVKKEIVFEESGFITVNPYEDGPGFIPTLGFFLEDDDEGYNIIVIGNIYENSELLEKK